MNRVIGIFMFFMLQVICYGQEPFGTINTKWTFEGWSQGSGWEPNWEGNCLGNRITYEVLSKRVIAGKTCGVITSNSTNDSLIVYQENEAVYFYEDSVFYKLYDYTAQKGDTVLTFRPSNAGNFSLKVFANFQYSIPDSIYTLITEFDTINVNGVELRRWKTEPIFTETDTSRSPIRLFKSIIENIGSLNGPVGDHYQNIGAGCYGGFVCYQSDQFEYGSSFFPLCEFPTSITEQSSEKFEIFPNPTSGVFELQINDFQAELIEVYNIYGVEVLSTKDKVIDLSEFKNGVYIIVVKNSIGKFVAGRIVKQ